MADKPWVNSIFEVASDLVENDLSENNQVFVAAFGGQKAGMVDILFEIENRDRRGPGDNGEPIRKETIEEIYALLKTRARNVHKWARTEDIQAAVTEFEGRKILDYLRENYRFFRSVTDELLPPECRGVDALRENTFEMWLPWIVETTVKWPFRTAENAVTSAITTLKQATPEQVMLFVLETKEILPVEIKVYAASHASRILRGWNQGKKNDSSEGQ